MTRRRLATLATLVLALSLLVAACAGDDPLAEGVPEDGEGGEETVEGGGEEGTIEMAAVNFGENVILAEIYGRALTDNGIATSPVRQLSSREGTFPALESGEIDFLPEYSGNALEYVLGGEVDETDEDAVVEQLRSELEEAGLTVLEPSPAINGDANVVTSETAEEYGLETVSDLEPVASELVITGAPEFAERGTGLPGLEEVYGLQFADFLQTDACGQQAFDAMRSGEADVARMCTTDPPILEEGWVILEEDLPLSLPNNIIPIVRADALTPEAEEVINAVSAALTTEELTEMNVRYTVDNEDAIAIAQDFVDENNLGQ